MWSGSRGNGGNANQLTKTFLVAIFIICFPTCSSLPSPTMLANFRFLRGVEEIAKVVPDVGKAVKGPKSMSSLRVESIKSTKSSLRLGKNGANSGKTVAEEKKAFSGLFGQLGQAKVQKLKANQEFKTDAANFVKNWGPKIQNSFKRGWRVGKIKLNTRLKGLKNPAYGKDKGVMEKEANAVLARTKGWVEKIEQNAREYLVTMSGALVKAEDQILAGQRKGENFMRTVRKLGPLQRKANRVQERYRGGDASVKT